MPLFDGNCVSALQTHSIKKRERGEGTCLQLNRDFAHCACMMILLRSSPDISLTDVEAVSKSILSQVPESMSILLGLNFDGEETGVFAVLMGLRNPFPSEPAPPRPEA